MKFKLVIDFVSPEIELLIVTEIINAENSNSIHIIYKEGMKRKACLYDETNKLLVEGTNEINRYLARTVNITLYGGISPLEKTDIDHWISFSMQVFADPSKIRHNLNFINNVIATCTWLVNKKFSLADIYLFCALQNQEYIKHYGENYDNITRWYKHIQSLPTVENALRIVKNAENSTSKAKNTMPEKEQSGVKQIKTKKQEGKFIDLPGAEMGKVVVRFPPEASGYLHIGHAKAALLNQYYAETFQGKLIMRFDDTNPAKETVEFEKAILQDLEWLEIKPYKFTHTSDYFDLLEEYCTQLISKGKAFVDNTPAYIMKKHRDRKLKSDNRDNSVEKNLELWQEMRKGTAKGIECCVRAKIDYESTNGCMRDPTIYRCKPEPHPRTRDKYKVYPTYDFACPIVDVIEEVTHTLRTTEYHDRDAQFYWILDALGLHRPHIWEYSRLNMTYTVLSKRKLTWFVDEAIVDGWDDPRFPTVRGIKRRGMTLEGLKQFIIAQGSSKSVVFMEWDKIWAFNKKVIDPVAVRYTALDYDKKVTVNVTDARETLLDVQNHPKDPSKGTKQVRISSKVLIEGDDAKALIEGQNATFINWGNLMIEKINMNKSGNIVNVKARLNLTDKNYKNTLKITWIAAPVDKFEALYSPKHEMNMSNPIPCYAVYFNHIINKPVLDKDDDFKDFVAKDTRKEVKMWGETSLLRVKKGEIIQLQRKGFFICDVPYAPTSLYSLREQPLILFQIPDGHATTPSASSISQNQQRDVQHKTCEKTVANKKELVCRNSHIKSKEVNSTQQEQPEDYKRIINKIKNFFFDIILNQNTKIKQLKSVYNEITGQDWDQIQITSINTNSSKTIAEQLNKQINKIQNLINSKVDKSIIDKEMKIFLSSTNDYKNAIDQEGKLTEITDAAQTKEILPTRKLSQKMQNHLRILEHIIYRETTSLLNLKEEYQMIIEDEWKLPRIAIPTHSVDQSNKILKMEEIIKLIEKQDEVVQTLRGSKVKKDVIEQEIKYLFYLKDQLTATSCDITGKETFEEIKLYEQIKEQGDKVRNLKSLKADKSVVDKEVNILLSLKNDYRNATGRNWKPSQLTPTATSSDTATRKETLKGIEIAEEINKQGDKVRNLKSSKADKSIIDEEVKILLSLKNDYKNATGQDWKPSQLTPAVSSATTSKETLEGIEISEKIKEQGDKVRNLKSSKADKSIIDKEVKILLSLKNDYKNVTGQDWKPSQLTPAVSSATTSKETLEGTEISEKIKEQGDKVRNLKSSKAEKSIIDKEVKILLKDDYKNVTGQDWKSSQLTPTATSSDTATRKETLKGIEIAEEINKQGDKVRNLKSSKADKSIIDKEVKILLSLKNDYKNVTGQDWKPSQLTPAVSSATTSKETLEGTEISEKIKEQGDKVRNLKSSKAEKSIIDKEVKILLKDDYKNVTGQDWKSSQLTPTATSSDTATRKETLKGIEIAEEINKQGDKVRNLKSSKADKSVIDKEVKILLRLKNDYKNATGQDWKPTSNVEVESKKKKEDAPKPGKVSQKEIAKSTSSKDVDTGKTGTRLGLEAKKEENFFDWYSQVITKSGMIEYYDVSGCYILRPWSFAIWKIIKEYIDKKITTLGVQECYFPIFVTRGVLEKEKTHIADFAPEVAWVTKCGDSDLAEPIAIRPTSETVMYPAYAKWLRSDTELPLRLNQWNNVVRWEFKDPKPFLRTREFLWQEGHTAFATKMEAEEEVLIILDMYAKVYEDLLAIPVIKGRKTEKEKFAGGDYTTTVEAFVSTSGRAVQGATSHHLGQNFSKMFNIQMEGLEGDEKTFIYQNSWGLTTRTIGVMIMVHGDDKGLVLPPRVASIQGIVIPCGITATMSTAEKELLQSECVKLVDELSKDDRFRVKGDFRNNRTPGWKFNHWELKGVPVRIELGPKDLEKNQVTFVRRDNLQRIAVERNTVATALDRLLKDIQALLFYKAKENLTSHIKQVENWSDFGTELNKKNLLLSPFCGDSTCEDNIKMESAREDSGDEPGALSMGAKSLCIPFEQPKLTKSLDELKCIHHSCKNKAKFYTLFGRSY